MNVFPYNINIPFATNSPSVDQPNMLTNTNSISSLIAVDHYGFNIPFSNGAGQVANAGGFHTLVHLIPQPFMSSATPPVVPTPIGTVGQLWSETDSTGASPNFSDQFLYYMSGGGRYIQLSGVTTFASGNQALSGLNGYTALPGGLIIQWGQTSTRSGAGPRTVVLPTPFLNNFYTIVGSIAQSSSLPNLDILLEVLDLSNFTLGWSTNATNLLVNWIAIGN